MVAPGQILPGAPPSESTRRYRARFWRLFWILFGATIFGVFAAVPMTLELIGPMLAKAELPPVPLPLLILIGAVQNLALIALFVGVGLKLGGKLGLGPKLIEKWLASSLMKSEVWTTTRFSLIVGLGVGAVLLPPLILLASSFPKLPFVTAAGIPVWKRFLVCFYGGIYEEIFMRLCLLSLFGWLFNRGWRGDGPLSSWAFWLANVIVAILFGLGHLPSVSLVMPITPPVVIAALLLNGVAALAFGWLYRKLSLEAAMVAHFTADFVLYVVGPYFLMS